LITKSVQQQLLVLKCSKKLLLLGLLGTVIGMIETFQAITLFGTGDPKQMAGGISQALVTTMLGLIVAAPLLGFYTYISDKASSLIQTVEEKASYLLAK
jgi:biopolymer transport protein ExbB